VDINTKGKLLGEQWDLHNRYLHIHPAEEWSVQPNLATPTSNPTSNPTSTVFTGNENILRIIRALGDIQKR
jgi:hypothetical protein